ncbi:MAG: ABC transporter substrate-binding protein [Rhodobacteraceae bacterium]|nr:ABC transporter substrate-binding protein [Paracoccaceae bacterium]
MHCLSKPRSLVRAAAALALLLAPPVAVAQDGKSIFMVLWRGETAVEQGFRGYFSEKGLPVTYEVVSVDRDTARLPEIVARIKAAQPDLVYTWGTPVTLGIAGADPDLAQGEAYPPQVTDLPIVFSMVSQPVLSGVVDDTRLSHRNVTGVSHVVPMETQVQAMQAYMPVDRIATIYTDAEPNSAQAVAELKAVGERYGLRIDTYTVPLDADGQPDPASIPELVAEAAAAGPQFLYLGPDSFLGEYAAEVADAANAAGLATFASTERSLTSSDALYGLVAPYYDVGRFAAQKAEAVLFDGVDPGAIPVETLPSFSYRVRLDVAQRLGILPAMSLMDYAEIMEGTP